MNHRQFIFVLGPLSQNQFEGQNHHGHLLTKRQSGNLFVEFVLGLVLFGVVFVGLLKVFRQNNIAILAHGVHTALLEAP